MGIRQAVAYPSADEIAQRAHELFITGGRRIALIPEYWRTAERELLSRAADRVLGGAPANAACQKGVAGSSDRLALP